MVFAMYRIDCDSGGLMERPQDCPVVSFGIDPVCYETRLLVVSFEVFIVV